MALLPSDPQEQKRLLIGVLPLLLLFGYWYFYHGKLTAEIAQQESRLERLESKNNAARAQLAKGGDELAEKLALYEEHMTRLEQLIPTNDEVAQLLDDITRRSQATGVDLTLIRPQTAQPGTYYTQQSYELTVTGVYHDVGRFLTAIGSLPRIVRPVDLQLQRKGGGKGEDGVELTASFRIQTYVLPASRRKEAATDERA